MLGRFAVPGVVRFPETNVRTYVRAADGTDGLWFWSLQVTNRANEVLGRALRLPYRKGNMNVLDDGRDCRRYTGESHQTEAPAYQVAPRRCGTTATAPLDVFLTGRWSAYMQWGTRLLRCDVEHEPWPLEHAEMLERRTDLAATFGISAPTSTTIAHFATGVDARISRPTLVRAAA